MDPISATSVAALAIQVVDISAKIISKTIQLSRSGGFVDNEELEKTTKDLLDAGEKLEKSMQEKDGRMRTGTCEAVLSLAKECRYVADELLAALERLKPIINQSKWRNLRLALLSVWRAENIDAMERRLDRFRQQLILRLLESLREDLHTQYEDTKRVRGHATEEVGKFFLQHLQATKELHITSARKIEQKLFEAILFRAEESRVVLSPPEDRTKLLSSRLLNKLHFPQAIQRQEAIPVALTRTFAWLYQDPKPDQHWTNFRIWLTHGNDIYWITGKPGSGKSTLMKYIHGNSNTQTHITEWSKGSPLTTAGFYFWNSGVEIQMSTEGLLRSLLYQILSKNPQMIPDLFPERWETLNLFGFDSRPWTLAEYLRAFRCLSDSRFSHHRIFLIIDGLDEFLGDYGELIDLLKTMVRCGHIKICLASRPWVVFQDAFNTTPNLMLQDLNIADIRIYVRTRFDQSEQFLFVQRRDPSFAKDMLEEIASRSSGVFLWVRLVVQSLLEGMSNGDRIMDLRQRLGDLPSDLEDLFRKILDSLEPRYRQHASELFQIQKIYGSISALRLSFADEENESIWKDGGPDPLTMEGLHDRRAEIKRRVDSNTKGLLETQGWKQVNLLKVQGSNNLSIPNSVRNQCVIQYLHRTVKDYIETESSWNYVRNLAPNFNPHMSLCKAFLLEIKSSDTTAVNIVDIRKLAYTAMQHASKAYREADTEMLISLLDALNKVMTIFLKVHDTTMNPLEPTMPDEHHLLFTTAVQLGVEFWVSKLLDRGHPIQTPRNCKPYIYYAIHRVDPAGYIHKTINPLCLRLLLEQGASIHEKQNDQPFWKYARFEVVEACKVLTSSQYSDRNCDVFERWMDAVEIMADFGADLSSIFRLIPERKLKVMEESQPDEMARLRVVLRLRDDERKNKSSETVFNSPRANAIERLKRRRFHRSENSSSGSLKRPRRQ